MSEAETRVDHSGQDAPSTPSLVAKAEGALVALAAGDALGWPQERRRDAPSQSSLFDASPMIEFRTWTHHGGGRFDPYEEPIRAGEYSDDTQLALAVARCRRFGGSAWWRALTREELPLWTLYERGGGGATKRAATSWLSGAPPWSSRYGNPERYFAAGGNGVAMRVLPHAIHYGSVDDPSQMIRDVIADGVATHGHPRALVGAAAYAYAVWWLLRTSRSVEFGELVDQVRDASGTWGKFAPNMDSRLGWSEAAEQATQGRYHSLWEEVVGEMRDLLNVSSRSIAQWAVLDVNEVLGGLGCFGRSKGSGTVSAAAAIYLFARFAVQPVQGVLKAAFAKGADTDTVAAMTGGLIGSLRGLEWIPFQWHSVQDGDYIRQTARRIARGPECALRPPTDFREVGRNDIQELKRKLYLGTKEELDLGGERRVRITASTPIKQLSKRSSVNVWEAQTSDGQTLFLRALERRSAASSRGANDWQVSRMPEPSLNTIASLLLTAPLDTDSALGSENLLTVAEYHRLGTSLRQSEYRPADMLDSKSAAVIEACENVVDPTRIRRLLARRTELEESLRSWLGLGGWVAGRTDRGYPRSLKARLREAAPIVLYGRGNWALVRDHGFALFGSADQSEELLEHAERIGSVIGHARRTIVSRCLTSVEETAFAAALRQHGAGVVVCSPIFDDSKFERKHEISMEAGRLAMVWTWNPLQTVQSGNSRSHFNFSGLTLALSDTAFVVGADEAASEFWRGIAGLLQVAHNRPTVLEVAKPRLGSSSPVVERVEAKWPDVIDTERLQALVAQNVSAEPRQIWQGWGPFESSPVKPVSVGGASLEPRAAAAALPSAAVDDAPLQSKDRLLESVERELRVFLSEPKALAEIAVELGVSQRQAKRWMTELINRGVLEKLRNPARYAIRG